MWRSIRARISILAMAVIFVVMTSTAVALAQWQRSVLTDNLDEALTEQALALAQTVDVGALDAANLVVGIDDDAVLQVSTPDGEIHATSSNLIAPLDLTPPPPGTLSLTTIDTEGGAGRYRLATTATTAELGGAGVVVGVGTPLDDIDESISVLKWSLATAIPLVVAILGGLVWWLVGRTLRPVESIRLQVAEITARDLHRRVSEPDGDDEIRRLAVTMNDMLGRLESSATRQRQFIADASHELRSPLTRIRSEVEVDLVHPDTSDAERTHRSVLQETANMQQLVDDLLVLARHDETRPSRRTRTAVDLDDIVLALAHRGGNRPQIRIDATGVSGAQVRGDSSQLERMVSNILDNAERHASTTIDITLSEVGGVVHLSVTDDGPGVPPDKYDAVFERFLRLDDSRSRHAPDKGGNGLGLAISRAIAESHGGSVTIDPTHTNGARFVVELPAATTEL